MSKKIWITRPFPQAMQTAHDIKQCGGIPVCAPVINYVQPSNLILSFQGVTGIICTSQEALRVLEKCQMHHESIPIWCAGIRSGQLAKKMGFTTVHVPEKPGAQGILESITQKMTPNEKHSLLYVSGATVTLDLAEILTKKGYNCQRVILYLTEAVTTLPVEISTLDGVLFFSQEAIRVVLQLCEQDPNSLKALKNLHAGFLNQDIWRISAYNHWKSITIPDKMDSQQLIHEFVEMVK